MLSLIQDKILYFKSHRFVQGVATLQFAGFLGSVIQAILGLFLARALQPENFGIYVIAFGLASLIFISTGVHETTLVVLGETYTNNDRVGTKDALAFFVRSTGIFILVTLAVAGFLPLIGRVFYHNSSVGYYALIIILSSSLSSSVFSIVTMMLQVAGKIKQMATLILVDHVLRFSLSLFFVLLGYGLVGAMVGHLVGAIIIFIASLFIWVWVCKKFPIFPSFFELLNFERINKFKKYFNFTLWTTLDKNIAGLYAILPILLIGIYVSTSEVTYFKLAFGFVALALSMLGPISVLLNFEFPKMRIDDPTSVRKNFIKVSKYSLALSTVLTIGAVVTAPFVFRYLYGVNFLPSIKYVFGLFIYGALFGIGVGLGPMWRAIDKVKVSIIINSVILVIGIPAGFILIRYWGLWGAVIMVTLWYTISHFISFIYLNRYLKSQ